MIAMKTLSSHLGLLLFLAPALPAATFSYSGPGATDIDNETEIAVTLQVPDSGILTSLVFSVLTDANYADNLRLSLYHNGVLVRLLEGENDSETAYLDATFSDGATEFAPSPGSVVGHYLPVEPLSAFHGLDVQGAWELRIIDLIVSGDGTELLAWSISGETMAAAPEPGSWGTVLGAMALTGLWRRGRQRAASKSTPSA